MCKRIALKVTQKDIDDGLTLNELVQRDIDLDGLKKDGKYCWYGTMRKGVDLNKLDKVGTKYINIRNYNE